MDEITHRLKGDTGRLAATYLAIIMALTIVFSGIIYAISSAQFDRPLPRRETDSFGFNQFDEFTRHNVQQLFQARADQARSELLLSLFMLNVTVLMGGAVLSYYLARRTLVPIEQAMEAQNQFVSDASHELRTPLAALQVTNEVALRKKKLTLAQAKELIAHNLSETIKLNTLSNALLGLAKQENADTRKTSFDVGHVVDELTQSLIPRAAERSIQIVSTVRATKVVANQPAVEQIMRIFLDNAIKYSPERSVIEVRSETSGGQISLSVIDHGPGIPASHHSRIFDRFYRVDESRSASNTEGNGLGLAIAKAVALRHGYAVELTRSDQSGSTFSLRI